MTTQPLKPIWLTSTKSDTDTAKAVLMQPCKRCCTFPQTDQNFFNVPLKAVSFSY